MSIYDSSIEQLTTDDIDALLKEGAVENVRLEFKREDPNKDEWLKKLSSLANTYGGYLVLGADADQNGRLTALSGIKPISGLKQRLVQWCHDGTSPPVQPFVSTPIPTSNNSEMVCYVIFVEESAEAPHFINSRKGAYVRTNEFSQRFEARLATYDELLHLLNRREQTVQRRVALLERARIRFDHFVAVEYAKDTRTNGPIGATLQLFISPRFPSTPLISQRELLALMKAHYLEWRQVGFPRRHEFPTQHESVLAPNPAGGFSILEASVWGHIFLSTEVEDTYKISAGENIVGIHLNSFMGHLLVFLEYARVFYSRIGFNGTFDAQVRLQRVRTKPWLYFVHGFPETGPTSLLDDDVSFALQVDSSRLCTERDDMAKDLAREIFYALNWPDAADSDKTLDQFVRYGREFNYWNKSQ